MIPFNVPLYIGKEHKYIEEAIKKYRKLSGDGSFTKQCQMWLQEKFNTPKSLLTTSCTHALEMAAILCDIKEGDEIIAPSYTFVSTVNAFVLRGAKIKFVDIRPDTMNINEDLIEEAITDKTKAIVVVHYAGVSCEMSKIMDIGKKYNLFIVEDAAQGMMSQYKGQYLGVIGDFGTYSFHETKNYTCGEGGALLINNDTYIERAEIIREKGTNRNKFFRGQIDKYTWVDIGSSYLPSELNAAYLFAQLQEAEQINYKRLSIWNSYYARLQELEGEYIELPHVPENCIGNGHMFYIKCKDLLERAELIDYLKANGIIAVFHYVPLHTSQAGLKHGTFHGQDIYTTKESERLLRLPMYYDLEEDNIEYIVNKIKEFYKAR